MAQLIGVNLNQYVRFQLTAAGADKTRELIDCEHKALKLPPSAGRTMIPDVDGFYRMALWDFMHFYGASFYNGGPVLVVNNSIQIIVE
jgi:hypothetical protein